MAASSPSSVASSLGLSLRPEWLEQAARAAGGAASAELVVSLALNADFNCVGAGGALPADLEVCFLCFYLCVL